VQCDVYQVGAVLLTVAWLNLLTYMRQLPVVGQYIIIFHDVLKTFLSFILVFFIFVLSFALGFYLLLDYQVGFKQRRQFKFNTRHARYFYT
jgi:transient receptor potential cation channel subfamily A protein 1